MMNGGGDLLKDRILVGGLRAAPFLIAGLTFCLLLLLGRQKTVRIRVIKSYVECSGFLRKCATYTSWYQRKQEWLCKNGAAFHCKIWGKPLQFLAFKIVLFCGSAMVLTRVSPGMGFAVGGILFLLPEVLIRRLNATDNDRMLPELRLLYQSLEQQIRAGVYVMDALAECYSGVQQKRLRQALLDMAGDIVMKADIQESLQKLQGKFDNGHVDALCITIQQAMESGQAVELLGDLSEQIKDMEKSLLARKKGALDRRITIYQLLILAAVLGMVLYACVSEMFTSIFLTF